MTKLVKNLRLHYPGCYRLSLPGGDGNFFAQIHRVKRDRLGEHHPSSDGRQWAVEIRDVTTGALVHKDPHVYSTLRRAAESTGAPRYVVWVAAQ